jgi:hypothetical protein
MNNLCGEGPRYYHAANSAAQIVNLLGGDYPGGTAQLYSRVLFLILYAMCEAEEEVKQKWLEPSPN